MANGPTSQEEEIDNSNVKPPVRHETGYTEAYEHGEFRNHGLRGKRGHAEFAIFAYQSYEHGPGHVTCPGFVSLRGGGGPRAPGELISGANFGGG